jgi:hypothetical protein
VNPRLVELALKRQRLQLLAAAQRLELQQRTAPFLPALAMADRVRAGIDYLKRHPEWVTLAVTVMVVTRPRRAFRWARRGFFAWRFWRRLRREAAGLLQPYQRAP